MAENFSDKAMEQTSIYQTEIRKCPKCSGLFKNQEKSNNIFLNSMADLLV